MIKNNVFSQNRISFIYLTIFLILVNLIGISTGDLPLSRLLRLCSVSCFLILYYLAPGPRNRWITFAISVLFLRDIFFQFYELWWGYKLYLGLGSVAYLLLIADSLPRLRRLKFNPGVISITLLLILINTYTLYTLMGMLSHTFNDPLEVILFYLYGALLIVMAVTAVINNNRYNSDRSLNYLFLVLAFIFSDIAALFAYYFGFENLYYADRIFFIMAAGFLANYGLNERNARQEFFEYEMIDKKL